MHASITVSIALSLRWTTSTALAQETPAPTASATAHASNGPAQRSHRLLLGGSVGGGSYGADGAAVLGLDASYAYRLASGRNFGVTGTLATDHMFAGAFADVVAVEINRNVSWRLGADLGVHRISNRYSSFDLFPKSYQILSAPNGVFLPYAGAKLSVDRTRRSGSGWGLQLQARQDLVRVRHTVLTEGYQLWDMDTQAVGGRTVMLGFYIGQAM